MPVFDKYDFVDPTFNQPAPNGSVKYETLAFIEWAQQTGIPIRNKGGQLVAWNEGSSAFELIESFGRESFYVGEIGRANVELRERLVSCEQRLTSNDVSKMTATVFDPQFVMYRAGFFQLERTMTYNGYFYRLTSVTMSYKNGREMVNLEGRAYNAYKLKQDKGPQTWTGISPTEFAQLKAVEAGLEFFGEVTAVDEPIQRVQDGNTDESTWDVLSALAKDNGFVLFEANNKLFFASEREIIAQQDALVIDIPAQEDATLQLLSADFKRTVDDKFSGRADFRFHKNAPATRLSPGMSVRVRGLGDFDDVNLMIENVQVDISSESQVRVSTRATEKLGGCALQTFQRGSRGDCVKRIQSAIREFTATVRISAPKPRPISAEQERTDGGWPDHWARETFLRSIGETASPRYEGTRAPIGEVNDWPDHWARERAVSAFEQATPKPPTTRQVVRQLTIDGIFGPNTERAVKQFQTASGLPSTGVVDRATWEAIERKS